MNYSEVRPHVQDGYLVFMGGNKLGQRIIKFITRGEFTHVGFACWLEDHTGEKRLMCLESSSGGARLIHMSAYADRKMTFMKLNYNWDDVAEFAYSKTGVVHYGYLDLIMSGARDILTRFGLGGIAKFLPNTKGEICSEFVAKTLNKTKLFKIVEIISPNSLYRLLLSRSDMMYTSKGK